ncbi:MAG: hypothetical protein HC923_01600 [Myxococcales bacterium]|nr:hypothetical protein [Myxococcales bacterium]
MAPWLSGFERHQLPKELGVATAALLMVFTCRWRELDRVDVLLFCLVPLSLVSAVGATDVDALSRSIGLEVAFVGLAIVARRYGPGLSAMDAATLVVGGLGSLVLLGEAYGAIPRLTLDGFGPGGVLGHRNEAAHALVVSSRSRSGVSSMRAPEA